MKKTILIEFWVPKEVIDFIGDEANVIYPKEEITGLFPIDELKKRLADVEAVVILGPKFNKDVIDCGKKLQAIARLGVGCDNVDCVYAGQKGIAVINTPDAVTHPTAELTIAIMMDAARRVTAMDKKMRREKKCFFLPVYAQEATSLYGKTVGVIGFGRIGKAVGAKAHGLGMKVVYHDVIRAPQEIEKATGAKQVGLDELLRTADFVTVHCPYIPENHHLINAKTLAMMKPTAYLINASRGKMVDEAALVAALKSKTIKGAALDVYEMEPAVNQELIDMDNVVLSPHAGTWSYDARVEMAYETLKGTLAILRGETPPNVFNREHWVR